MTDQFDHRPMCNMATTVYIVHYEFNQYRVWGLENSYIEKFNHAIGRWEPLVYNGSDDCYEFAAKIVNAAMEYAESLKEEIK